VIEPREEAEFHNIVSWGKLAEICSQLLKKGRRVYIEGRLQTRSWEGKDGVTRRRTEIVAEDMVVLDQRPEAVAETGDEYIAPGGVQEEPKAEESSGEKVGRESDEKKTKKGSKETETEKGKKGAEGEENIAPDEIPF
jgi:single stranded DNA-binding protein